MIERRNPDLFPHLSQQHVSKSRPKYSGSTGDSSRWKDVCQSRMKIPHFAGRKFPTPEPYKAASFASDAVEPSAVFWRVLGGTESEAKELDAARSCSRAGTSPALRRSFNR